MSKATLRGSAVASIDANGRPRCKCGSTIMHADFYVNPDDVRDVAVRCKACKRPIYSVRLTLEEVGTIAAAVVRHVQALE